MIGPWDRCAACMTFSNLQEHHLKPRSKFGKTRKVEQEDPSNKLVLCAECHRNYHDHQMLILRLPGGRGMFFVSVVIFNRMKNMASSFINLFKPINREELSEIYRERMEKVMDQYHERRSNFGHNK